MGYTALIEELVLDLIRSGREIRCSPLSTLCPIRLREFLAYACILAYLVVGIVRVVISSIMAAGPDLRDFLENLRDFLEGHGLTDTVLTYIFFAAFPFLAGQPFYKRRLRAWSVAMMNTDYKENVLVFIKAEFLRDGYLSPADRYEYEEIINKHINYRLPKELADFVIELMEKEGYIKAEERFYRVKRFLGRKPRLLRPTKALLRLANMYYSMVLMLGSN